LGLVARGWFALGRKTLLADSLRAHP
jgi:hypothetical protein